MPLEHAPRGPSSRHRRVGCPGSVREEAKYPADESSESAIDGTRTHHLLEICLQNGWPPEQFVEKSMTCPKTGEFVVKADRAARVRLAIDYIAARMTALVARGGTPQLFSERRVDPAGLTGRGDMWGTVDVSIWDNALQFVELADYKDGVGEVVAENNPQLIQYAIAELADRDARGLVTAGFTLTIIQPKMKLKGKEPISSWSISAVDLRAMLPKIIAEEAACDDPNAPLIPGDHCKFCRAKGCTTRSNYAAGSAGMSLATLEESAARDPSVMGDDELAKIMLAAPMLRSMLEAVEKEVFRRVESGQHRLPFKLVAGRASTRWALSDSEIEDKLRKAGVPKDSVYKRTILTPKQISEVVWTNAKGDECRLSQRQVETIMKEYTVKTDGKPTLAGENDPRKPISGSKIPEGMFGPINQPTGSSDIPDFLKF